MNHDVAIVPPAARPWLPLSILAAALAFAGMTPSEAAARAPRHAPTYS